MKCKIQGITDTSTIDWPGKLAAVVFFQGCNLRCPWCQNPDGVIPNGGKETDTKDIIHHLATLDPLVDAVVLWGESPPFSPLPA